MVVQVVLLGDIGGTNIRLRLVKADSLRYTLPHGLSFARFLTQDLQRQAEILCEQPCTTSTAVTLGLIPALKTVIGENDCVLVCLSVCGPVVNGNVVCLAESMGEGWVFNNQMIAEGLSLAPSQVVLVNDFVAIGTSLPLIPSSRLHCLYPGKKDIDHIINEGANQSIACMGTGTGLGVVQAIFSPNDSSFIIQPSEAGMATFCPRTNEQWELIQWLEGKQDAEPHVCVEMLVSGSGIHTIYQFLRERYSQEYQSEIGTPLDLTIMQASNTANLIVKNGPNSALCHRTVTTFLDLLGAEAGEAAMRFRPLGGLYLAGGFTDKLLPLLQQHSSIVVDAFLRKGRSRPCCEDIPLLASSISGDNLTMIGLWEHAQVQRCLVSSSSANCRPRVFERYELLSDVAARIVLQVVRQKPNAVLCLATGATPAGMYRILREHAETDPELFRNIRVVKLDEWIGLERYHPSTCEYYLRENFLNCIGIDLDSTDRFISFHSDANDPQVECERVEKILREWGEIDCCILGIGVNGHIGMNEPVKETNPQCTSSFEPAQALCRISELCSSTQQHSMLTAYGVKCERGLTLSLEAILNAKEIVLLANGASKASAISAAISNEASLACPASMILRKHRGHTVHLLCDADAAGDSLLQ